MIGYDMSYITISYIIGNKTLAEPILLFSISDLRSRWLDTSVYYRGLTFLGENSQKASTRPVVQARREADAQYVAPVKLARLIVSKDSQTWNGNSAVAFVKPLPVGWQTQAFYQHAPTVVELLAHQ